MPPPTIARMLPNFQLENGARNASPTSSKGYQPSPPPTAGILSPTFYSSPPVMPQRQISSSSYDDSGSSMHQGQSGTSKVRRQRPDTEEIRKVGKVHYQELLAFLRTHLAKEQTGPRSNAREKLTRLSKQQFTELSTDVYDELMRRINNTKQQIAVPHLAVREEFHPKRNQARQKLATLPKTRFKDLSSDVFFELERRFPELKEEYRPEAIAREKALEREEQERRLREDVARREAQEREREAAAQRDHEAETRRLNKAAPKESTSDMIVPTKSRIVEEEDVSVVYRVGGEQGSDEEMSHNQRVSTDMLDNRSTMYSQASSMGTGFVAGYAGSRGTGDFGYGRNSTTADGPNTFGIEKLRSDYEFKIATLQQRVATLEAQNGELREHSSRGEKYEEQLRLAESERDRLHAEHVDELDQMKGELDAHKQKHDEKARELESAMERMSLLQKDMDTRSSTNNVSAEDMERLQSDLAEQDRLIQDLRSEIESLIQEIQQLSSRNEELVAEKDQDLVVARDLNQQLISYKRKYEQAKTELRQYKATSQLYVQPPKTDEFMPTSDRGIIADVNVTAFQSSIDELLATARSTSPSNVLVSMKAVVLAATLITDDVAKFEESATFELSADDADQLMLLKPKISTTLNNLMNACRNHASSQGLSPVSLLDAAASHVSMTVVDLVRVLKLRSATQSEKDQFEAHFSGNALPPGGLKPLHIGSSAVSRTQPISPSLDSGATKLRASGERKSPIDAPSGGGMRLSPRGKSAPSGRYSPVGYRPSYGKIDTSVGNESASRNTSFSQQREPSSPIGNGSNPLGHYQNGGLSQVTSLPRTNLDSIKKSWTNGRRPSSGSVSHRRTGTGSYEADTSGGTGQSSIVYDDLSNNSADRSSRSLAGKGRRSVASASTPPRQLNGAGAHDNGDHDAEDGDTSEENWAELRNYIEVQTEAIVHSIQSLLSAIREGAQGVQLNENLVQITTIASSIIAISRDNLPPSSKEEGEEILGELTDNCEKLSEMQTRPSFDKSTKSAMASASYGVAKGLKALNGLLTEGEAVRQREELEALR
ncbi:hypothetical protein BCV69DRAFT_281899 [Microstroma glucosiphilum]|uniref:GIT Spa2 homology (SHD) domain-containing protein n=1 Tax=Pseudomicrostroma glucosiphilum TaxID=1684307 RepID=A0A316UC06_9BASI|nr:hypothetical protein BCV69DRAFT_281899 [Pseudomicrostroma glucosiphilum]PWN21991.1 hypothetical protein BCV69DRAFT_281899 [Pseudomicrostroma glucosiphilum]